MSDTPPRKYPPEFRPIDWNTMVDFYNGFTPTGNFVLPCSFVIYKFGAYYYANNAFQTIYGGASNGGEIDGLNFSAVLQAAANAIHDATKGGLIFIRAGTYRPNTKVVLEDGVSVIGEGSNAVFAEVSDNPSTLIKASDTFSDDRIFQTSPNYYGTIANLAIDGNDVVDKGIWAFSPQGASFENLVIRNFTDMGFMLEANATAGTTATHNFFRKIIISDTDNIGMDLKGESNSYPVTLNTFIDCRFEAKFISLRFEQYADTNTFIGGRIEVHGLETPGGLFCHGIVLGETTNVANSGVYNNAFYNVPIDGYDTYANGSIKGVYLNWNDTPNYFYGGVFGGPDLSGMDSDHKVAKQTHGQAYFYNFRNYVTENEGYVDAITDLGTIAHGLVREPRQVQLTSHEEMYFFSVNDTDDTNITVNIRYLDNANLPIVIGGVTYYFAQMVIPEGTHSVYWKASVQPVGVW
jgi:hypothetical protein